MIFSNQLCTKNHSSTKDHLSTLSDDNLLEHLSSFRQSSQFISDFGAGLFFMIPLTGFFTILGYKIGNQRALLEWMPVKRYASRAVPNIVTTFGALTGLGLGINSLIDLTKEADLESNGKASESFKIVNTLRQRGRSIWSIWRDTEDRHRHAMIKKVAQNPIDPSDLTVQMPEEF